MRRRKTWNLFSFATWFSLDKLSVAGHSTYFVQNHNIVAVSVINLSKLPWWMGTVGVARSTSTGVCLGWRGRYPIWLSLLARFPIGRVDVGVLRLEIPGSWTIN